MNLAPVNAGTFGRPFDFEDLAEAVWQFQLAENAVMRDFCAHLGNDRQVFMPIRFFKEFEMRCGTDWQPQALFESSGTTGAETSRHLVRDLGIYEASLLHAFRQYYAEEPLAIFALLPHYLERGNSSLVHMVKVLIEQQGLPGSGFYLHDFDALRQGLAEALDRREKVLLIGVSYALLDFAQSHAIALPADAVVMETGGMKGRGEELSRARLHAILGAAFGKAEIHSEYGMTELLSQAYLMPGQGFRFPSWAKFVLTDIHNPMKVIEGAGTGRINIIDLANVHSCAFIATDDIGRRDAEGHFQVLGRLDNASIRGCNLMYLT